MREVKRWFGDRISILRHYIAEGGPPILSQTRDDCIARVDKHWKLLSGRYKLTFFHFGRRHCQKYKVQLSIAPTSLPGRRAVSRKELHYDLYSAYLA
ncbi:hypothetical protein PILCRDRAFT_609431 [Piloderma croceum F 1598]|uniref:Uncharacterized protein n=1 Tax=Piloderma croceum (strain F 1598) TaxID=765440 RepID=A0A0C3BKB3_PILCF|nr:hypothetical protein PILCRDRAFT_609431 [Piloderma croceum F 1598]